MYYLVFGLLWLVSLLPFRILYFFSDCIYALVFYVFKYRKDIVLKNISIAFPEKSDQERLAIAKAFYHNLIDTFIESLKFISISRKEVMKRASIDLDLANALIAEGKNVHLMAGHQFNWEYGPFIGIYMPITNKVMDRIFFNFRKKFGTVLISATDFKTKMHHIFSTQYALGLAADQNPGNPNGAYWMHFMGKPVPFVVGPAKGAVKHNTAVLMFGFNKIKRGYYHFDCKLVAADGAAYTPQQLTLLYKNELEKVIRKDPANYLWSHRRWKYEWKPEYGPLLD